MTTLDTLPRAGLRCTPELPPADFITLRRHMQLACCKWDSQIGDLCALANFALILDHATWAQLSAWSLALANETLAAEAELLRRPELWPALGMPRRLRRTLAQGARSGLSPSAGRTMRFDFHPTHDGWRISEINSDVPGGYTESSSLPALIAPLLDQNLSPLGNPGHAWARAIARAANHGTIALLCAPGLIDDMQILAYLRDQLARHNCNPLIADLRQLRWHNGRAVLLTGTKQMPADAIVRFYQAEWLAQLPRSCGWPFLFAGGQTPVSNPPASVLTESKAFPLLWDQLQTPLPTWRKLLPPTFALKDVDWRHDDRWILKERYSNNGESVILRSATAEPLWRRIRRDAFWFPGRWVAQQRFDTTPLETPHGPMRPCLGIYVIDGRVAGVYGRLSRGQIVDFTALDVAVLLEGDVP